MSRARSHALAPPEKTPVPQAPQRTGRGWSLTRGRPLEETTRRTMESQFGYDFSAVRVHDDARAAAAAGSAAAAAFTVGQDVVFGAGRYEPASAAGRRLLAHELAHTVQQRGATTEAPPVPEGSALEAAAYEAATPGSSVGRPLGRSPLSVARQPATSPDVDWELKQAMNKLLDTAADPRTTPELADKVIEVLQVYASAHSTEAMQTVAERSDELYALLAPWGFTGGTVVDDVDRLEPLVDSFHKALAAWQAETPEARQKRRAKTRKLMGSYMRMPTEAETRHRAQQVESEELPTGEVYEGAHENMGAEREQAKNREALAQAAAVAGGGALATVGRLAGAVTAWATDRDVQKGGELGAAIGGVGDVALPVVAGAKVRSGVTTTGAGLAAGAGAAAATAPTPQASTTAVEATPAQVRALYAANPDAVQKSLSNEWHQTLWERNGGKGPAPIAFSVEGRIRVNEIRWPAVGELAEINRPGEIGVEPQVQSKSHSPEALADTGAAAAQPAAESDPGATKHTPPPRPARRGGGARVPAGYTPVQPEVAAEAYSIDPSVIVISGSPEFHQKVWKEGGGKGKAPLAFRVGKGIRVDVERWPAELRAGIGL